MKKILAAIASFILLNQASAQSQSDTPSNVTKWEIRKEGKIAHYKKDGRKHYAYYTHDGQWKATESPVRRTRHLPPAVQTAWKNSGYTNWYVHNIRKIETGSEVTITNFIPTPLDRDRGPTPTTRISRHTARNSWTATPTIRSATASACCLPTCWRRRLGITRCCRTRRSPTRRSTRSTRPAPTRCRR